MVDSKRCQGLIRVRQDIPEVGRKRFAVGHEIGHWILHEKISQFLACTTEDLAATYKNSDPELEANYFSSELLMPERLFAASIAGIRPDAEAIKQLAKEVKQSPDQRAGPGQRNGTVIDVEATEIPPKERDRAKLTYAGKAIGRA